MTSFTMLTCFKVDMGLSLDTSSKIRGTTLYKRSGRYLLSASFKDIPMPNFTTALIVANPYYDGG